MAVLTFRSPVTTRLHPHSAPVPPAGEFRVTQRFSDPDYYWSNAPNPPNPLPTHNATDIGNFRCNDPIVAMAPGIAYRIQDNAIALGAATNALGVRIDHGFGITSEYWHLNRQDVYDGQPVNAGHQIGLLGSTGLGAVCHTHIEVKRNGTRIDPEPLMFGGSVEIGEDEDMRYPRPNKPFLLADIAPGNNLRSAASLDPAAVAVFLNPADYSAPIQVGVFSYVTGAEWQGSNVWAWIGYQRETYLVHSRLLSNMRPTVDLPLQPTGFTQEQLDAEKAKASAAGFGNAKAQAIVAAENNLATVRGMS